MSDDMFLCDEDNAVLEAIRKRLAEGRDPLDETDHHPRHDVDGEHREYTAGAWHHGLPLAAPAFGLAFIARQFGPLTFCDCPC